MTTRVFILVAAAGAMIVACGPRSRAGESSSTQKVSRPSNGPLSSSLNVSIGQGSGVKLDFEVTNTSDRRIELVFPGGQTHDFAVLDTTGRELWRWSEGRMFTQAIQTKLLGTGETVKYQEEWDTTLAAGKYIAVAQLSSDEALETRVEFEVR